MHVDCMLLHGFNPNAANLRAKTAFVDDGFSVLCIAYLFCYHPETARRSYEELDELFTKRVPARKLKLTTTDAEMSITDSNG